MVYKWKTASRIKADPQLAGEQFEYLQNTVGLTAKTVLDANREIGTLLHNEFEWDDTIAAEKYRVDQAGQMIRMLCIVSNDIDNNMDSIPIRAYFPTESSNGYERTDIIFKDEDKYKELLAQAYKELKVFKRKYESLLELQTIFDAIEQLDKSILKERR